MKEDWKDPIYKGEIYGRIWEVITWNKEEKDLQYLSNLIFMAAKEDIKLAKDSNGQKISGNENLYGVLERLMGKEEFSKYKKGDKGNGTPNLQHLEGQYDKIKENLESVRVLGVGNSTLEKIGKSVKIFLKTMASLVVPLMPLTLQTSIELADSRKAVKEILKDEGFVGRLNAQRSVAKVNTK